MKKITLLLFSTLFGISYTQIPTIGQQAYYQFNNDVSDVSGNGNTAIVTGCNFVEDRFGNPSSALNLDGIDDLLEMPIAGFGPITGDYTISFWLKSSEQFTSQFMSYGDNPDANSFTILTNSSGAGIFPFWFSGVGINADKMSTITNNQWHHVVFSSENDVKKIWVDKILRQTKNITEDIGSTLESFFIGANFFNTMNYNRFSGSVDDLAFYDRALNLVEIDDLFHDNKKIVITSPKKTDAYPENNTCKIEWKNSNSITNLKAEYSIDNGANWIFLTNLNLAAVTFYNWNLNFPIGTNVLVKLSDLNDLSVFDVSNLTISEYHWDLVNPVCDFSQRDGQDLLVFNNKFWQVAGWSGDFAPPSITTSEIWSSTDGIKWEYEIEAPWNGRHAVSFVEFENKIWLLTGDGNSGLLNKDTWNTDDMIHWTKISDSIQIPERVLEMSAVLNGKMLVFGGQQLNGLWTGAIDTFYNDVYSSTDGVTWNQLTSNAPWKQRGIIHGQCIDNANNLWLLGGGRYNSIFYSDIWNTADGITWNKINDCAPFPARIYFNVEYFDNKMWVMAGNQGLDVDDIVGVDNLGDLNDVWYSSNGIDWFELKNTPWPKRHAAATAIFNNGIYLTGGYENDFWKLVKD